MTPEERAARREKIRAACAMPDTPELESTRFLLAELEALEEPRQAAYQAALARAEKAEADSKYMYEHLKVRETWFAEEITRRNRLERARFNEYEQMVGQRGAALERAEKAEAERDVLKAECASISAEFDLPPTIRPAEGEITRMREGWKAALEREARLREVAEQQAEDGGLWFRAGTAPEAYLQRALRRLHAEIECDVTMAALAAPELKSEMEGPAGPALPMQHASSEPGASREPAGPFGPDADAVARMRAEGEELRKELARRVEPMKHRPFYASTRRIQELEADVEGLKLQKAGAVRALGRVMGELREARAQALEDAAKVAEGFAEQCEVLPEHIVEAWRKTLDGLTLSNTASARSRDIAAAIRALKDEAAPSPQTPQSKTRTR